MTAPPGAACNIPFRRGRVANTAELYRNGTKTTAAPELCRDSHAAPPVSGAVSFNWEAFMKQNTVPESETQKEQSLASTTLDASSTYQVEGRTFVVQPVFQETGETSLAALLLNLMRADASFK